MRSFGDVQKSFNQAAISFLDMELDLALRSRMLPHVTLSDSEESINRKIERLTRVLKTGESEYSV